jgi:hypothetical protein
MVTDNLAEYEAAATIIGHRVIVVGQPRCAASLRLPF